MAKNGGHVHEGGKVGRSVATPIKKNSDNGNILGKFWVLSRPYEMTTFGPNPHFIALSHLLLISVECMDDC